MDAVCIHYWEPIAQDEVLLNHFLELLSISQFSSHMQALNSYWIIFFNSLSLGFLFHLQILSFPSAQLPKQWGWPCCFGARHTLWNWWSFTCAEMMLAVYCGNDKALPGLLVACWFGCCWGEGVCHSGVRGSSCVGVRTPWLSELLPWPLMVAGQSRPWFLLCLRGQSPAGCSAWEIRSAVCFSQTHFLVSK